jgi:hypothetical protein
MREQKVDFIYEIKKNQNYLRTSMSQERIFILATISVEYKLATKN